MQRRVLVAWLLALAVLVPPGSRAEGPAVAGVVELPVGDARWSRASIGVHAVDVATGETVAAWRSDAPMVPASAQKALTAAVALRALGPSHTFVTRAYAAGRVIDGELQGDLVLVGEGDPTLTAERLWRLLRDLKTQGIERIAGDVLLDDTRFVDEPAIPGWERASDLEEGPSYYAPIGALAVEFGGVSLVLRPGPAAGDPAVVVLETPAGDYVRVVADVATVGSRDRTRLDVRRVVRPDHVVFEVEGQVREGSGIRRFRRAVPDPTAHAGGVIASLLATGAGPALAGRVREGLLPPDAVEVGRVVSPPLGSVLMDMNKYSSNFMAELVLRSVGASVALPGSTASGLGVARSHVAALGVPPEEAALVNGSGLSRQIRLSPRALTTVLADAARDPTLAPELVASLAIGGRDGTLRDRLDDLDGRVRAKTGTLSDVVALAGFVVDDGGRTLAFAFFANEIRGSVETLQELADDVVRRLAHPPSTAVP